MKVNPKTRFYLFFRCYSCLQTRTHWKINEFTVNVLNCEIPKHMEQQGFNWINTYRHVSAFYPLNRLQLHNKTVLDWEFQQVLPLPSFSYLTVDRVRSSLAKHKVGLSRTILQLTEKTLKYSEKNLHLGLHDNFADLKTRGNKRFNY